MVQIKELQGKNRNCTCSNPNCRSVFSQPKILKYYICPDCQSLLEIEGIPTQPIIEISKEGDLEAKNKLHSINLEQSKEIKNIKINLNKKLEDIKNLQTKNTNLSKKLEEIKKNLVDTTEKNNAANRKLEEKTKKLVFIAEKNLDLINRVESLEINRANYKLDHQDHDKKIIKLNLQISKKVEIIKSLNEKLSVIEEEILQIVNEKESAIRERDSVLSKLSGSQSKVNEEIESRVEVQIELTNLKEKMADIVRRESEAKEKNVEYVAKIQDLELEIERLETEIKQKDEKKQFKENVKHDINNKKILNQDNENLVLHEKNIRYKKPQQLSQKQKTISTTSPSKSDSQLTNKQKKFKNKIKKQNIRKNKYLKEFFSEQSKAELIKKLHENESSSDSNCNNYLGYLAERDKNETIPNACIACPKSIDCMLNKVHQSNNSVQEIKKWYRR